MAVFNNISLFQVYSCGIGELSRYSTVLTDNMVTANGDETHSALVPQLAEELVSLLDTGLALPSFLPEASEVRKVFLLLQRVKKKKIC